MHDSRHDQAGDDLDVLLDAALASYALNEREDEAVADVRSRTMVAMRAESGVTKKSKWVIVWPVWALTIAAALVLAMVLPLHRASRREVTRAAHREEVASHSVSTANGKIAGEGAQARVDASGVLSGPGRHVGLYRQQKATRPQPLPKLDVFPTPTPLSPEERALVTFVRHDPRHAQQEMTMPEQKPLDPLKIQPVMIGEIEVSPLNPPDKGEK